MLSSVYKDLGFDKFDIKLSTRPDVRIGSDETWDKVEGALTGAIENLGLPYQINPGDGAFYGPKLDFKLTDAIGREWQCGTFQVDPNLPNRLDAEYVGEDGAKHRPYMLHRAILGSFERFIGILIENYAGKLPFWLAPRQVVVASIVSDADPFVHEITNALIKAGVRAEADTRNEKINYKVREHSVGKVPVILAIGMKEVEDRTVSVRRLGDNRTETHEPGSGFGRVWLCRPAACRALKPLRQFHLAQILPPEAPPPPQKPPAGVFQKEQIHPRQRRRVVPRWHPRRHLFQWLSGCRAASASTPPSPHIAIGNMVKTLKPKAT